MYDFNFFKNHNINQAYLSESLKIFEHPNFFKSNYDLDDYYNLNENVVFIGFNFTENEIKLITDPVDASVIKYVLLLEQNIKIHPDLLNKDFIRFIVTNKKIETELVSYDLRFLIIPTFCLWVDRKKFNLINNNRNKILIYNGFSSADEQYCNMRQSIEIKRNIPSKNYIYTGSLNVNNPNIDKILNNVSTFLYLTNHKTFETEKLINILNLLNVKIISNNYFINAINYINIEELINIVKFNNNKDYNFNNLFNKMGIEQIIISDDKIKYSNIKSLFNLVDFEMSFFMDKNCLSKKILFMGLDNNSHDQMNNFANTLYYLWTDEDEYEMKYKLNKFPKLITCCHLFHNDIHEKILKQNNIILKEKININLFMCKNYDFNKIDLLDINAPNNNILINNEYDDLTDSIINSKFESTGLKIHFFNNLNNNINIKYFIDLSYYYNSKLDKLLIFCKKNNIKVYSNNLPEDKFIKNFDDLDDIILEINGN